MRTAALTLLAATLASAITTPCTPAEAIVVVEASHGGAGSDLTNTTIVVPVGPVYTNDAVLDTVSTLYLLSPSTVTCTPYKLADGTGTSGLPFTVGHPSLLSTNTVQVGSLVCLSE
ncbi:hypothetical protein GGS24DRAFT_452321 [Hypoxylon argillaceum]|nr:hypothetical protein GGS24DRAFT_452321 [Hypoxylon argillaceum]KAI1149675.1 hypothetical protein F4825DRAFT_45021 [Nemania diffusa]